MIRKLPLLTVSFCLHHGTSRKKPVSFWRCKYTREIGLLKRWDYHEGWIWTSTETVDRLGGLPASWISDRGLIPRLYKELKKLNTKVTQTIPLVNGIMKWAKKSQMITYKWVTNTQKGQPHYPVEDSKPKVHWDPISPQLEQQSLAKPLQTLARRRKKCSITLCWWGHKLGLSLIEINIEIPESLKRDLSYDLDILFLGSYQNTKLTWAQGHLDIRFYCSTIYNGQFI